MNTKQSYRGLRIAYFLLTKYKETQSPHDAGRDLYDLIEESTTDKILKSQMAEGRQLYKDKIKTLKYLNHRLNIGF